MTKKQTVFVVDDEPAVAKALSRLLRASGYATQIFGSAQEFMECYEPGAGGCLLLDISMPEITGLDLQRWMATSVSPLPILFLTALDDSPEKLRAISERAVGVLMKPVDASELVEGVEEALARDRDARRRFEGTAN